MHPTPSHPDTRQCFQGLPLRVRPLLLRRSRGCCTAYYQRSPALLWPSLNQLLLQGSLGPPGPWSPAGGKLGLRQAPQGKGVSVLAPRETQRAQIYPQRERLESSFCKGPHPMGQSLDPLYTRDPRQQYVITPCAETGLSAAWKPKKTAHLAMRKHFDALVSQSQSSQFPPRALGSTNPPDLANPSSLHSQSLYLKMLFAGTSSPTGEVLPSLCSRSVGTCALSPPLTKCN